MPPMGPALPPHPGPFRVQPRKSLSEMANEQLRRGKPKDPLAFRQKYQNPLLYRK